MANRYLHEKTFSIYLLTLMGSKATHVLVTVTFFPSVSVVVVVTVPAQLKRPVMLLNPHLEQLALSIGWLGMKAAISGLKYSDSSWLTLYK